MAGGTARLTDTQLGELKNTLVVRITDSPQGKGFKHALVGWGTMAGTQQYDDLEVQGLDKLLHMLADQVAGAGQLETIYIVYQK